MNARLALSGEAEGEHKEGERGIIVVIKSLHQASKRCRMISHWSSPSLGFRIIMLWHHGETTSFCLA